MERGRQRLQAAIFGPTGLAGTGVVHAWLGDPRVAAVRAVTRRPLPVSDPRLEEVHCEDFVDLEPIAAALTELDAVCFCLGISASQAESKADYERITHGFALAAGRATLAASPQAVFHFISGAGTSERSLMHWARVKGATECDLERLGLRAAIHWRPAMIYPAARPERLTFGQRLSSFLVRPLRSLRSVAVDNTALGEAMLQATVEGRRGGVVENREIRALAERYRADLR